MRGRGLDRSERGVVHQLVEQCEVGRCPGRGGGLECGSGGQDVVFRLGACELGADRLRDAAGIVLLHGGRSRCRHDGRGGDGVAEQLLQIVVEHAGGTHAARSICWASSARIHSSARR